jgi:hypothetical protein
MVNEDRVPCAPRTRPVALYNGMARWRVANDFANVLSASPSVTSGRSKVALKRLFHT